MIMPFINYASNNILSGGLSSGMNTKEIDQQVLDISNKQISQNNSAKVNLNNTSSIGGGIEKSNIMSGQNTHDDSTFLDHTTTNINENDKSFRGKSGDLSIRTFNSNNLSNRETNLFKFGISLENWEANNIQEYIKDAKSVLKSIQDLLENQVEALKYFNNNYTVMKKTDENTLNKHLKNIGENIAQIRMQSSHATIFFINEIVKQIVNYDLPAETVEELITLRENILKIRKHTSKLKSIFVYIIPSKDFQNKQLRTTIKKSAKRAKDNIKISFHQKEEGIVLEITDSPDYKINDNGKEINYKKLSCKKNTIPVQEIIKDTDIYNKTKEKSETIKEEYYELLKSLDKVFTKIREEIDVTARNYSRKPNPECVSELKNALSNFFNMKFGCEVFCDNVREKEKVAKILNVDSLYKKIDLSQSMTEGLAKKVANNSAESLYNSLLTTCKKKNINTPLDLNELQVLEKDAQVNNVNHVICKVDEAKLSANFQYYFKEKFVAASEQIHEIDVSPSSPDKITGLYPEKNMSEITLDFNRQAAPVEYYTIKSKTKPNIKSNTKREISDERKTNETKTVEFFGVTLGAGVILLLLPQTMADAISKKDKEPKFDSDNSEDEEYRDRED